MSSVASRLDAVATATHMAEEMRRILGLANVRNERLLGCLNRLRHECARHERELIHILARRGDREDPCEAVEIRFVESGEIGVEIAPDESGDGGR